MHTSCEQTRPGWHAPAMHSKAIGPGTPSSASCRLQDSSSAVTRPGGTAESRMLSSMLTRRARDALAAGERRDLLRREHARVDAHLVEHADEHVVVHEPAAVVVAADEQRMVVA